MIPVGFPGANASLLGGPRADFGTELPVGDLPVYRGALTIVSCWRPSWREILCLLFGGRVWLQVHTPTTHAPVALWAAAREKP